MELQILGVLLTFSELFSGFVGAIVGGLIALGAVYWQAEENARHNLRSVVTKMGIGHFSIPRG